MFDNLGVNLRKNEGFLIYIPCIPIPEYGQSNAPLFLLVFPVNLEGVSWGSIDRGSLFCRSPTFPVSSLKLSKIT